MSSGEPEARRPAATGASRGRSSLTIRLGVWYAVTWLASVAILSGFALYVVRHAAAREAELVVQERLERHRAVLGQLGLPEFERTVAGATALEGERGAVRVQDSAGRTLYKHGEIEEAGGAVATSITSDLRLDVTSTDDPWTRIGPSVRAALVALLAGCLLVGVAGGALLTRRALRPVTALATTARAVIQSGDLSRRVDVRAGQRGELDDLALLFNRMLERNQALVRSMSEALDNVAHDLRTPLTRLRGIAEVALRGNDPAQSSDALADCIEESDRALVMLRTLMDISEAEAGIMKLQVTDVDLRALTQETLDLYEQVADDAGVRLGLTDGPPLTVPADDTRVRQALANLVDNAVKYTPRGGRVELALTSDPTRREATVRITDTGVGIPAASIHRIWDRLYRVDPSRSQRGLGLGLSLVKAIASAHGGRVAVESTPGQGSSFAFVLPLDRSAPVPAGQDFKA